MRWRGPHFCFSGNKSFWFRMWSGGPGFVILHRSDRPLFSERYGYRKFYPKWPARFRIGWVR